MSAAGQGGSADVLVTGAGSFVGNYIVRHLSDLGVRVRAVYRTPTAAVESLQGHDNVVLVHGDLAEPSFLESLFPSPGGVIHVAASGATTGVSSSQLLRDNALATAGLVDYAIAADCPKFIFLSSVSVHGDVREPAISVGTEIRNPDVYGLTKRFAEVLLEERSNDLASVAVRLPAVLGRGARTHWLSRLVATARSGREIEIFNPSSPFNNGVHQVDLCRFMVTLLDSDIEGFQAFPVASSEPIPISQVVATVLAETASLSPVRVAESSRVAFVIDDSCARREWGYESLAIQSAVRRYAREEAADD